MFRILTAAALVSACLARSQTASVNLQRALLESQEGRAAAAHLDAQWRPRIEELDKELAALKAEEEKFEIESKRRRGWRFWRRVLSRREKGAEAATLAKRQNDIERHRDDGRAAFEAQRASILQELSAKIRAVAEEYGRDHGLRIEYREPAKAQSGAATDITPDIIRLYDQLYPAKPQA